MAAGSGGGTGLGDRGAPRHPGERGWEHRDRDGAGGWGHRDTLG